MQDILVDSKSLLPVAIETLLNCEQDFAFDLYLWTDPRAKPVLYREKTISVSHSDFAALLDNEIRTLYITTREIHLYEQHVRDHVLTNDSISPEVRFCAMREANRSVFMASLNAIEVNKVTKVAQELGNELASIFSNNDDAVESLLNLLRHDYYTYTHVTNVCAYSMALAQGLGISNRDSLAQIATGALLHDVGKRKIPPMILNKAERLTEEETAIMKAHPLLGYQELCHRNDLNWEQLMMVYQHHERLDGGGYPVQIAADEILPWSRMCTIADIYDAITSYRPYRRPMHAADVQDYLTRNSGTIFDAEMIRCWSMTVMPKTFSCS